MGHEPRRRRAWVRAAVAGLLAVATVAVLVPLRGHTQSANLALVLVLVVLVAAVVGGPVVGVVVGVIVAIAFDFFLTEPYGSLTIASGDDLLTTVLLAAVGLIGGVLVERARRSERHADEQRHEVERLQRRAELAASGEPAGRLIMRSAEELADLLDAVDVRYQPGPAAAGVAVLTHDGARVPSGPGAVAPDVLALPVRAHGRDIGHFLLLLPAPHAGMAVPVERRHAAIAVADQLGVGLLRHEGR